jgi:hypothetical protein
VGRMLADGVAPGVEVALPSFRAAAVTCYVVGVGAAGACLIALGVRGVATVAHAERRAWLVRVTAAVTVTTAVIVYAAFATFVPLLIADQTTARFVCGVAVLCVGAVAPVVVLHLTAALDDRVSWPARRLGGCVSAGLAVCAARNPRIRPPLTRSLRS